MAQPVFTSITDRINLWKAYIDKTEPSAEYNSDRTFFIDIEPESILMSYTTFANETLKLLYDNIHGFKKNTVDAEQALKNTLTIDDIICTLQIIDLKADKQIEELGYLQQLSADISRIYHNVYFGDSVLKLVEGATQQVRVWVEIIQVQQEKIAANRTSLAMTKEQSEKRDLESEFKSRKSLCENAYDELDRIAKELKDHEVSIKSPRIPGISQERTVTVTTAQTVPVAQTENDRGCCF